MCHFESSLFLQTSLRLMIYQNYPHVCFCCHLGYIIRGRSWIERFAHTNANAVGIKADVDISDHSDGLMDEL